MNRNRWTELIKLGTAVLLAAFLWQQVAHLRKARGAESAGADMKPRWVIQMLITENETPIRLIQFVFTSFEGCRRAASQARKELELDLVPACSLRWVEARE